MREKSINSRFSKKKAEWVGHWKPKRLKGLALRPSARTEIWFSETLAKATEEMTQAVTKDVLALFQSPAAETMDAVDTRWNRNKQVTGSIAAQSRMMMSRIRAKYEKEFAIKAKTLAASFVGMMLANSTRSVKASLKKATGSLLNESIFKSARLNEIIKASVTETANLIKRIPADYLGNVESSLLRSITTKAGSPELYKTLEEEAERHNIRVKNWVYNTARDQTNKVFSGISRAQMQSAGVKKFEWLHSGGGSHPRELHITPYEDGGLNGGIFEFDDPPVIQFATKSQPEIRGYVGQLPNCRCKCVPVIEFEQEE